MPIKIDYTPVGALAGLAQKAGANLAKQTSFMNALRMKQLDDEIWARKRAQDMQFIQLSQSRQTQFNQQRIQQEQFQTQLRQFKQELDFRYSALSSGETLQREMAALDTRQKTRAFEIQEATGLRRGQKEEFDRRLEMMEFETPEQKRQQDLLLYGGKRGLDIITRREEAEEKRRFEEIAERLKRKQMLPGLYKAKKENPRLNIPGSLQAGRHVFFPKDAAPKPPPELRMLKDAVRISEGRYSQAIRDESAHIRGWGIPKEPGSDLVANRLKKYREIAGGDVLTARREYAEGLESFRKKYPMLAGGGSVPRGPVPDQGLPPGIPVGRGEYPPIEVTQAAVRAAGTNDRAIVEALVKTWGYNPGKKGK